MTEKRAAVRRRKPGGSAVDRLLARTRLSEATLRRAATWTIMGALLFALVGVASLFGLPGVVGQALAEGVGRAGFRVEQVDVTGVARASRAEVLAAALDQRARAMPLVDLDAVRTRLLRSPWIADAHVSRRLPDTLLIRVVERAPVAVWQYRGRLALVDAEGRVLAPVAREAMPALPLLVGVGANARLGDYARLIAAAPALKPLVRAASWIGDRRWNLTFESGETLELPEGADAARAALARFAGLDKAQALLGKGWIRFDMRDPARLVARKPGAGPRPITDPEAAATPAAPALTRV